MDGDDRLLAYLRLNAVPNIGPVAIARLLAAFDGDPTRIFSASREKLRAVKGIGPTTASALRDQQFAETAADEWATARDHGIDIMHRDEPRFPPGLNVIGDPPAILYVRGEWRETDTVGIAIVGTRNASYYGADQAKRFGRLLAQAGFSVISGFARGVDTAAHRAALDAGGRTVAVIGSGLLEIYPPENADLVGPVAASGCVISEFPLRTAPNAGNFPRRNRIIAALSLGTLVVEADVKSGAMITARLAMEYGREVFAIPGKIDGDRHRGCHKLIKEGAKLVEDLPDILDELGGIGAALAAERETTANADSVGSDDAGAAPEADLFSPAHSSPKALASSEPPPMPNLSPDESAIYAGLSSEPQSVDALATALGLPVFRVTSVLTMLELKGAVRQLAGRHYIRAR